MPRETPREQVGLPLRPFFYSMDQIASMLAMEQRSMMSRLIYFDGRSTGARQPGRMLARNIAPDDQEPLWRVAEVEFIRWLRHCGFRIHAAGTVRN